jgi:hypothetical protein
MIVRPCREEELPLVLEMSDAWVEEGCCNGMERDDLEYLKQFEIFLALEDERPVGYAYGRARTAQKKQRRDAKGRTLFRRGGDLRQTRAAQYRLRHAAL